MNVDPKVDTLLQEFNNWHRWGPDDELGTLNLIDPEAVGRGASSIEVGVPISCSRALRHNASPEAMGGYCHRITLAGDEAAQEGYGWSADQIALDFHGYDITHLDALAHQFWNAQAYNDHPARSVTVEGGATRCSVEGAGAGFVTRGFLMDIPHLLGIPWIEPRDPIEYDLLVECETMIGRTLLPGDALLIRTGRDSRQDALLGNDNTPEGAAGLSPSCLRFFAERDVAVLGSDAMHDVTLGNPRLETELPIHAVALTGLGLWLIDNAYLEDLAAECRARQRWTFQLVVAPLRIERGTGSPVNPLAIL